MKTKSKLVSKKSISAPSLDMGTIRERVARIKASWTDEVARERAEEGRRRRLELEQLLGLSECSPADQFSLVG